MNKTKPEETTSTPQLEELIASRQWVEGQEDVKTYCDVLRTDAEKKIFTFSTEFVIDAAIAFIAMSPPGSIHLVIDFTHDVCSQSYKLGLIGILCHHYVDGEWRKPLIPVGWCSAVKENKEAYHALTDIILDSFGKRGLNLADHVAATFSDGHAASTPFAAAFPEAIHFDCLQHKKGNVEKHVKKWMFGNKTKRRSATFVSSSVSTGVPPPCQYSA